MKTVFLYLLLVVSVAGLLEKEPISVHMIGDSTMSIKEDKARPETGWGEPFALFFDESVTVTNHAKNGRSTRSFKEEGRWDVVMKDLQEGDFVFIQFGHNDEVQTKKTATKPDEFVTNLKNYISDTRKKGATPVLFTSIARRKFNEEGFLVDTHKEFADLVRSVANEEEVLFIDMDKISRGYLTRLGDEGSKSLYNHLETGVNPNYSNGVTDNTHFSEYGARVWAQIVLTELKDFNTELNNRITAGR